MTTTKPCPGCAEPMHAVGAVAFMKSRCCGGLSYAICPSCARTMATANQKDRTALIQKIELSLAADEESPQ
jgi:hypothetical protein